MRALALALALAASSLLTPATGCRTTRIQPRPPVEVPPGLTLEHVELAILAALANESPVTAIPSSGEGARGTEGAAPGMEAAKIGALRSQKPSGDGWFPESVEPGAIVAGFQKTPHELRVRIRYTQYEVNVELLDSRNLKQSRSSIHHTAYLWIEELETRIRRSLGALSVLGVGQGAPAP